MLRGWSEFLPMEFRLLWQTVAKSDQFDSPEVVQVDDALELIGYGYDHEGGDFFLLHKVEGLGGEGVGRDGARICGHALDGGEVEHVFAPMLEEAAQVAVADD